MAREVYVQYEAFERRCPEIAARMTQTEGLTERNAYIREYLEEWRSVSPSVAQLLDWSLASPSELCEISRPGAWLEDTLYTNELVKFGKRHNIQFQAVGNKFYHELEEDLRVMDRTKGNTSPNNVGNIYEHLSLLAYEAGRGEWIVVIGRLSARAYMIANEAQRMLAANAKAKKGVAKAMPRNARERAELVASQLCTA